MRVNSSRDLTACQLQVNSFNRLDVDSDESGIYINPALAMVNHSCVPNAFVQFVGRNAVLHAYQEIKESEEIEISYIGEFIAKEIHLRAINDFLLNRIHIIAPLTAPARPAHAVPF